MTISDMPWYDCLNAVRAARRAANPNFGFQRQLQNFENTSLKLVREELFTKYGAFDNTSDVIHLKALLDTYNQLHRPDTITPSKTIDTSVTVSTGHNNTKVCKNPIDTYPLPYNAYNLDEAKKEDKDKPCTSAQASSEPTSTITEVVSMTTASPTSDKKTNVDEILTLSHVDIKGGIGNQVSASGEDKKQESPKEQQK